MKSLHYLLLAAGITLAAPAIKALPILSPAEETQLNCIEEEVTFKNEQDNITLCGSLIRPLTARPVPVALIIPGTGPFHRTLLREQGQPFDLYADIAKDLAQKGIAILIVDKRGYGKSTSSQTYQTTTFQESIHDSLTSIEYLSRRSEINPRKIGLIGHSEGGLLAPEIIQKSSNSAFVVLLAPCATDCYSSHLDQQITVLTQYGLDGKTIEEGLDSLKLMLSIIQETPNNEDAFTKFLSTLKLPAEFFSQPEPDKQQYLQQLRDGFNKWATPFCRSSLNYDPQKYLQQITVPVLALFAEGDPMVPPHIHQAALIKALSATNCCFTVKTLNNLSQASPFTHQFATKKLPSEEEVTVNISDLHTSPELLTTVSQWIVEKTA